MKSCSRAFLLFLFSCCCTLAQAQRLKELGIKTGIATSYLKMDTSNSGITVKTQNYGGFYMQLFGDVLQERAFSITASAGFYEKGGMENKEIKNNAGRVIGISRIFYPFRYVNLTAEGKLKANIGADHLFPYVIFGPRLDFLVSSPGNLNYMIHTKEIGANLGAGFDYDFPKISVLFEAKRLYTLGASLSSREGTTIKDHTYVISIGLKYLIKPKYTITNKG